MVDESEDDLIEKQDIDEALDDDGDDDIEDPIVMDDDCDDQQASSSPTFLHQLVAQRTAFVEVKQELTDDIAASHQQQHADMLKDNDEHLCVVCMDNERSCLYVPCNHLVVCVECDANVIMAAAQPCCPMCNAAIDREESVMDVTVA